MVVPSRIGVFGGTFDPPHVGHLFAAVNVRHVLGLDCVLLVVASVPWQKVGTRAITAPHHRLAMAERAVQSRNDLIASAVEVDHGGDSVTADTLELLHTEHPGADLVVIVGSDAAAGMRTWRRIDRLVELASVAVIERPGSLGGRPPAHIRHDVVPCPLMDLSSSEIRRRVGDHEPVDFLVTDPVHAYITDEGLYR